MLFWTVSDPAYRTSVEISAKSLVFLPPYCYTGGLVLTACLDGGTLYAWEGSRTHVPCEVTDLIAGCQQGASVVLNTRFSGIPVYSSRFCLRVQ